MSQTKRVKPLQATKQVGICALLLLVFVLVCRIAFFRNFTAVFSASLIPDNMVLSAPGDLDIRVEGADEDVIGAVQIDGEKVRIPIRPKEPGSFNLDVMNGEGEYVHGIWLHVDRFMTVWDESSGNFTGDAAVVAAVALFWLAVTLIMLWHFLQEKGPAFYSYSTIYYAGFFLFSLVSFISIGYAAVRHILDPWTYSMTSVYRAMDSASSRFLYLTAPFVLIFSIAMAVSNIELLRHERFRFRNILGLLIPLLFVAGDIFILVFTRRFFMGSEQELHIRQTVDNVLATVFAYFECMLAGSVICGLKAAKHLPEPDRDFILILGCRIRADGSLTPLLKGRADAAIAFWKRQKELSGKEAILIPSGGQGSDEKLSEAEAIQRYLLTTEIPPELIIPETESRNTYENMSFSKKLIDARKPGGKVAYATTNYHVFRSGVWASLAGLPAEGIGGKTKWWFWPNAFMRECVGLLQNRIRQEIILLLLIIVYFAVLSMLLPV